MIQLVFFIWGTDTILQQKSMKQKCYPKGLVGNQAEVVTSTLSRSKKGHPLAHPLFRDWKLNWVICFLKQRSCSEVTWINCVAPLKVLRTKQIHSGDGFNLPGSWKVDLLTWDQRQLPVAQPAGPLTRAPTGPPWRDRHWLAQSPPARVLCQAPGSTRTVVQRKRIQTQWKLTVMTWKKKTTSDLNVVLNSRVTSKGTC